MLKFSSLLVVLFLFLSCESSTESDSKEPVKLETQTKKPESKEDKIIKDGIAKEVVRINKNTKVKSVLTIVDGEKHGLCKQFYPSGKIWKESNYKENILDGKSKIYYESGKVKREVEYTFGKKDGKFIEYFKSGNVKTEITYSMDLPMPGFKEINYRKEKIIQPEIKVRHEDRLFEATYNLYFSLEPSFKKVTFYVFENKDDYWKPGTNKFPYTLPEQSNGEFKLDLNIGSGFYLVRDFHIYAVYTTKNHNSVVVYKQMNLAISND